MIKTVKKRVGDSIIVKVQVLKDSSSFKFSKVHHILLLDGSGSMSREFDGLRQHVKKVIPFMQEDDRLTVIVYSGMNQHSVIFQNAPKSDEKYIMEYLDKLKPPYGMTCFSEPFVTVKKIIEDNKGDKFNILLFTDGQSCLYGMSSAEDERRTLSVITEIKDKVLALNTIGYGYGYNRSFLVNASSITSFGKHIHSSVLSEYSDIFKNNYEKISELVNYSVDISSPSSEIFYFSDKNTKSVSNKIEIKFLPEGKNEFYIIDPQTNNLNINITELNNNHNAILDINDIAVEDFETVDLYYLMAYEAYYKGNYEKSLNILAKDLRDKYFIDRFLTAFTLPERQELQNELFNAIYDVTLRFKEGIAPKKYLPAKNAFCFRDLIEILIKGDNYYEPVKNYSRISAKTVDKMDLFKPDKDQLTLTKFDMDNFKFTADKLNISIRYLIKGRVPILPDDAKALGLTNNYVDTQINRYHAFIKDGNVNIPEFIAYLDDATLEAFKKIKTKFWNWDGSKLQYDGKTLYRVNISLRKLPTVNAKYNESSIEDVLRDVKRLKELKAQQKVLNYYVKMFEEEDLTLTSRKLEVYTPEQIELWKKYGFDKNLGYSGADNEKAEVTPDSDFYEARIFEFDLKGNSTLPSVKDLLTKPKKDTESYVVSVMRNHISAVQTNSLNELGKSREENKDKLNKIQTQLRSIKDEINNLSLDLSVVKLAKTLTGSWWEGLTIDKENYLYTKDTDTLVIKTKTDKIYV